MIIWFLTYRCEGCRICSVQIQPRKHVLGHAVCTARARHILSYSRSYKSGIYLALKHLDQVRIHHTNHLSKDLDHQVRIDNTDHLSKDLDHQVKIDHTDHLSEDLDQARIKHDRKAVRRVVMVRARHTSHRILNTLTVRALDQTQQPPPSFVWWPTLPSCTTEY